MNKLVTAVRPNGRKDEKLEPPQPASPSGSGSGSRFHYPGGSRPLEGFTIKRGIGHGGFGEVYYATSDGGKEVALKLIRRNLEVELRGVRHCLNLKHPNLLSVFDIREDDQGDKWVVMEYVAGGCLEDVIAAHPAGMPGEQILAWLHGIGAGVACLHDHGVVHRDLKPGNIFSDGGLVKIGDYGLSKFISCSRRSGQTESIGTVHYMAPEVANGRYGKEIDVYALGVILYEMLTGRVPFEGESVGEVLMKHLTATPDVSMLAEPYRGVVARALEKDPAKRFGSAGEFMAALPQPVNAEIHVGPFPSGGGSGRQDAYATTMPAPGPGNEEPIFRALRQFWANIHNWWKTTTLNTPMKVLLMILVIGACAQTAHVLAPLMVAYAVYWIIRAVVLANQGAQATGVQHPADPPPLPAATAAKPAPRCAGSRESRLPRWARREKAMDALVMKPLRERITDLVGSMLAGALVAVTMCLVMGIVVSLGSDEPFSSEAYSQYGWLVVMSIITTWAVLVPTKFWEGSRGDAKLRRFVLLPVGLALGLVAAGAAGLMVVDLPHDANFPSLAVGELTGLPPVKLYSEAAWSQMKYYLAAFGLLLLSIRWWLQTDPLRSSRLSLWGMFVCAFMAALVADGCGFPQPWLVMLACAVSASVQLSSPWIHPRKRSPQKSTV